MKSLDSKTPNPDWHPNIWPPFTQINQSKPQIEVTHGQDALLFTKNPKKELIDAISSCLLYTSPSPRDGLLSRMPSSA